MPDQTTGQATSQGSKLAVVSRISQQQILFYYAYAVNITMLRAVVKNYGFLKFFYFILFYFKLESSNIVWTEIVTTFDDKLLTMIPNS